MAILKLVDRRPDKTLAAMNKKLVDSYPREKRGHLGASGIGASCERQIWDKFHWVANEEMNIQSIKAIADGHHSEGVMIERLRLVPEVALEVADRNGGQFSFKDGHIGGSLDGKIYGVYRNPKNLHIWEHKCINEKKFNQLINFVVANEENALLNWDEQYFAQAQVYMHYFKIEWHYLTASSPGSRDETSCITMYSEDAAKYYIDRARAIISSSRPSVKVSESASWFQCKWCSFSDNCHGNKLPLINCRTCAHSTPEMSGTWRCTLFNNNLDFETQKLGCGKHLHNPGLVPGNQVDAGDDWVEYEMKDGTTVRNQHATCATALLEAFATILKHAGLMAPCYYFAQ
jgi:hypothetical protein